MTLDPHSRRRRAGKALGRERGVIMSYPGLRFGNLLYFALQAVVRSTAQRPVLCLGNGDAGDLTAFTALAPLFLEPSRLRWTDERIHPPVHFFQHFGLDFTSDQLAHFVRKYVLTNLDVPRPSSGSSGITINVRRGDYYAIPDFRRTYGIDVQAYLQTALNRHLEIGGTAASLRVVSDDPRWCRDHLGWLSQYAREVTYAPPKAGPLANFLEVAAAERLILANSTFSYWGAYASNQIHLDNHASVVVPHVHAWTTNKGRAWQHDPSWSVVEASPVDDDRHRSAVS